MGIKRTYSFSDGTDLQPSQVEVELSAIVGSINRLNIINVKDYGAMGDGVADDTTAITNAIASGACIYFPRGTYLTTGNHSITTQKLVGEGTGLTIIKRSSGTNPMFTITDAGEINSVTLDGNTTAGSCLIFNASAHGIARSINFKNVASSSYALQLKGTSTYLDLQDLEFHSNYGNIYISGAYYSSISRVRMIGTNTDFGIKFDTGATDLNFNDLYMESCINMTTTGIRDVRFIGVRVRLDSIPGAWFQATYNPGSEVGQISMIGVSVFKAVAGNTYPVFDISTYQLYLKNIHVFDSASSAGWSVIKDQGTRNLRLEDVTIESANAWIFFDAASSGGTFTNADGINYTQGVTGTATWGNAVAVSDNSAHITVRNSNINHAVTNSTGNKGGFIFEHIFGNVDLTNVSGSGVMLIDVNGTITDPNTVVIGTKVSGSALRAAVSSTGTDQFTDIASISLTPGVWDVSGEPSSFANGSVPTYFNGGISSTSGNSSTGLVYGDSLLETAPPNANNDTSCSIVVVRFTLASTTTIYLKARSGYPAGTPKYYGRISAVRIS